jgi:hypothetical protein
MATTQGFRRLLAAFLAAWVAGSAGLPAARAGDWMPLLPDQDFYDFQLFAPPDLREYSMYARPHEGVFFSYDRLYWGITVPQVTDVGETDRGGYLIPSQPISPQAIVQLNNGGIQASGTNGGSVIGGIFIYGADPLVLDLNTGWMRTAMSWGNRYEGGWIYDDRGVLISYFDSGEQSQSFSTLSEFAASSPTQIFTQTTTGGGAVDGGGVGNINQALITTTITSNSPPPDHLIAQKFTQENQTRIQSAGAAMIFRRALGRRGSGSSMRIGIGPRFLQFEDRFSLSYESNQYAFNQGAVGGNGFSGVNVGSQIGGGNIGGGALAGGGAGGGGSQFGGAGGGAGGGGFGNVGIVQTSAGDVLGIAGPDSLTGIGAGTPLQVGQWETATYNNMVGPELALLLESTQGRWTWSTELKFTAGLNWQNMLYRGANFPESIGADYLRATFNPSVTNVSDGGGSDLGNTVQLQPPPLFLQVYAVGQSNATNDVEHSFAFTPIGEWRLGAQYRVSQAITLRAGYTGLAMGSIARASSNTSYNGVDRRAQYAEVLDPEQPASIDNPWVVKTTGVAPPNPVPGAIYTDPDDPYFRPNPVYNQIGPSNGTVQDVVFANGVDFGIEVKY